MKKLSFPEIRSTGQKSCFDQQGREIRCAETGQDAAYGFGRTWPDPRFETRGELAMDRLTGLTWPCNANMAEFPLAWDEALAWVKDMNQKQVHGFSDWRLPNRRELTSLIDYQTTRPPLPGNHPFFNVILNWYWTSTSAAIHPGYAWYVHMEGGRTFYGRKDHHYLIWPVRGESGLLWQTGQKACFDVHGTRTPCAGTGQDGELRPGTPWPAPRFEIHGDVALDRLTGLTWSARADLTGRPVSWQEALDAVQALRNQKPGGTGEWRLPNILELESLVDCSTHNPALPQGHPFTAVQEAYWSSTTSSFETDWAWVLYLHKGALGVGFKAKPEFAAWPVAGPQSSYGADAL